MDGNDGWATWMDGMCRMAVDGGRDVRLDRTDGTEVMYEWI